MEEPIDRNASKNVKEKALLAAKKRTKTRSGRVEHKLSKAKNEDSEQDFDLDDEKNLKDTSDISETEQQEKVQEMSEKEINQRVDVLWMYILEFNPANLEKIKMGIEDAKRYKDMGKNNFKKEFVKNVREKEAEMQKELDKKNKSKKSSFAGNLCCVCFVLLFLFFMVYSKLNEEFWNIYKTRGSEIVDYYEILKVDPNASSSLIKKAYRRLAVQYHPDRLSERQATDKQTQEQTFIQITNAYQVLSNPEKREIYDSSYGLSSVGHYIKSKTTSLTLQNYDRLVLQSNDFWVIQVFSHDDHACEKLSQDWETLAQAYSFLKFGRIDFKSQMAIQKKLPFRVAELPFIYVTQKSIEPEFVQFLRGQTMVGQIKKTLMDKFQNGYTVVSQDDLFKIYSQDSEQNLSRVFQMGKPGVPLDQHFHFDSQFEDSLKNKRYVASKRNDWANIKNWLAGTQKLNVQVSTNFLLKINKGFNRQVDIGQGKINNLPDVLAFDTYKQLQVVKSWVDVHEWDQENFERLCEVDSNNLEADEIEDKKLCVISTDLKDIQKIQNEFSKDVFGKKSGPKNWYDDSKITEVLFGVISNADTQPYFVSLIQKIAKNLKLDPNHNGSITLIYSSESKGFRIKGPNLGSVIDIFESSLVNEVQKDDSHSTNSNKEQYITDFNDKLTEFKQILRTKDFSKPVLFFKNSKEIIFSINGLIALIALFASICPPLDGYPYKKWVVILLIGYALVDSGILVHTYDDKYLVN